MGCSGVYWAATGCDGLRRAVIRCNTGQRAVMRYKARTIRHNGRRRRGVESCRWPLRPTPRRPGTRWSRGARRGRVDPAGSSAGARRSSPPGDALRRVASRRGARRWCCSRRVDREGKEGRYGAAVVLQEAAVAPCNRAAFVQSSRSSLLTTHAYGARPNCTPCRTHTTYTLPYARLTSRA